MDISFYTEETIQRGKNSFPTVVRGQESAPQLTIHNVSDRLTAGISRPVWPIFSDAAKSIDLSKCLSV